jgi:rubrerythrin
LKGKVENTRNNLIQAIAGETFKFKKMYKSYSKDAKKENFI